MSIQEQEPTIAESRMMAKREHILGQIASGEFRLPFKNRENEQNAGAVMWILDLLGDDAMGVTVELSDTEAVFRQRDNS